MKKIIVVFSVLAVCFIASGNVSAQASIGNTTSKVVTVKSVNGSGELTIQPHKKAGASFLPTSGYFAFDLYIYEGSKEKYVSSLTKVVKNSLLEITLNDVLGIKEPINTSSVETPKVTAKVSVDKTVVTENPVIKNFPVTSLALCDSSDYRLVALSSPFEGVALAPGQETQNYYTTNTGQIEIVFKHDFDKGNNPSGRKYRQSVYSGIIVDGQKKLVIRNENLMEMGGEIISTYAKSAIPFKFVFTAGQWKGQALSPGDYTTKADMYEGFNSLAIQYVGPDGLKYQADIEVIVTKHDRPLVFKPIDIKNPRAIKQ